MFCIKYITYIVNPLKFVFFIFNRCIDYSLPNTDYKYGININIVQVGLIFIDVLLVFALDWNMVKLCSIVFLLHS